MKNMRLKTYEPYAKLLLCASLLCGVNTHAMNSKKMLEQLVEQKKAELENANPDKIFSYLSTAPDKTNKDVVLMEVESYYPIMSRHTIQNIYEGMFIGSIACALTLLMQEQAPTRALYGIMVGGVSGGLMGFLNSRTPMKITVPIALPKIVEKIVEVPVAKETKIMLVPVPEGIPPQLAVAAVAAQMGLDIEEENYPVKVPYHSNIAQRMAEQSGLHSPVFNPEITEIFPDFKERDSSNSGIEQSEELQVETPYQQLQQGKAVMAKNFRDDMALHFQAEIRYSSSSSSE